MNTIFRKLANAFEFFKSTIVINLAVCVFPFLYGGLIAFNYSFLSVGLLVSLIVKEINAKNDYMFYHNNQISKAALWLSSWFMSFVFLSVANLLFHLIYRLF
jgi:hypothetical protein